MILQELVSFATSLPTLPPPGYQPAFITKLIRLNPNGALRDVITLTGEKHGKREGKFMFVPREQPRRTSGVRARLVSDNSNYVLGYVLDKDKPQIVRERHTAWATLVRNCYEATKNPLVEAVVHWIDARGPQILLNQIEVQPDDEFNFQVGDHFPTDAPDVRQFWIEVNAKGTDAVCLVTGKYGPVVERMPIPIKGIPDGQMSGNALISVNNSAGESFGLTAGFNSPVSAYAAEAICNGLNYLIRTPQHALKVGKAIYLFWTRGASAGFSWDILKDPQPEDVQALLSSPHAGSEVVGVQSKDFFVLALSANAARIVIRDHYETTLSSVQTHIARWFRKITLIDNQTGQMRSAFGLFRLAVSLFREAKDMPPHVPTAILRSALTGTPLPDYLLGLAIQRNLAMQGPYVEYQKKRSLSLERLALIKAILEQKEDIPLMALNKEHPDPAYHCGRLLALLERIQRAALGDINATVVDRFYGAACASPASVLGNLVNDAQSHLAKLRKGSGDGWAQNAIAETLSAIGDHFPKTLSLPRQGLFALGFYHQKAADRAASIEAAERKRAESNPSEGGDQQ